MSDRRVSYYEQVLNRPDFDALSCSVLLNLTLAYDAVHGTLSRGLARHGVSTSSYNLLRILQRGGQEGLPLHEIGELLLTSRANVTGLVDCLETKGLVQRMPDPTDRRSRRALLTEEGAALLATVVPHHNTLMSSVVSGLSDAEKHQLADLLARLREQLPALSGGGEEPSCPDSF